VRVLSRLSASSSVHQRGDTHNKFVGLRFFQTKNDFMKLIIVLNKEITLGQALNALSRMMVGLGHQLQGEPDINIYFGTRDQVRSFRTLAYKIRGGKNSICSDFPHTMSGMSSKDGSFIEQVRKTASIDEKAINYLGCCFLSDAMNPRCLNEITTSCFQLKHYTPYINHETVGFLPAAVNQQYDGNKKRVSLLMNTFSIADTINYIALACLALGRQVNFSELHIINLQDKNGNYHGNISLHPLGILRLTNVESYQMLTSTSEKYISLKTIIKKNDKGEPLLTLIFGDDMVVERIVSNHQTRLFSDALGKNSLVPVMSETKTMGWLKMRL